MAFRGFEKILPHDGFEHVKPPLSNSGSFFFVSMNPPWSKIE
jgi:hypothetical protein